ncbi:MAG TPA: protein kinase [Thermoanaerobaculia bacterium]|nr:protein kinase [Thermoanaerobaculia bacterium]
MSNEILGHYEVLGHLGAGGMGEVYVARDPILGRKVAIKILPVRLANERDTLTRFTQEARSASALNHPNIVTIYEVGASEGTPFIVMEHIDGRDLREMLVGGAMPARKVLDIAAQIADGLAAAHERGIIHRDLKPENIMVTRDEFVKILDFGLAKIINPAPTDSEVTLQLESPGTTPGMILGTVGYMSPEQATGKPIDFRSDQFALGAILYELATGQSAFEGDTAIDTLAAILHNDPEPIPRLNTRMPAQFNDIVNRLLDKDPQRRYASTRDLAREIRTLRDRVAAEGSGLDQPRPPLIRRPKPFAIGLAAVGLAAFIAGGLWLGRDRIKPPLVASGPQYVAVLRFNDLSTDHGGQLLADGLAETLTARLARISSLQVIRPTSDAFANNDVYAAGRQLGVNLVLRGSMQRSGERLRVSYSILDLRKKSEVMGDTIDGLTSDLFDLQDKLAMSVASALDPTAKVAKSPPLDPRVSQQKFLEALGHLRRSDNQESVDAAIGILEGLDKTTNSATIQAALGRAYLYKFTFTRDTELARQAMTYCQRALAIDPQNPEVHVTSGWAELRLGKAAEAAAEFKEALALQPSSVDAILGLAEAYNSNKEYKHAEEEFARAVALQPNSWAPYNRLGAFYLSQGRYGDSERMFQKVIELVPDNLFGYNNLGAVYQQMGRYDDAIGIIQQSIRKAPTAQGYSNLGTCYYFVGKFADAATAYEKAVVMTPTNYRYRANLGDAYRWMQAPEKSRNAYQRAIELAHDELAQNPSDPIIRARLAECLAKVGRTSEARREMDVALQVPAPPGYVFYKAAVVACIWGDFGSAAARVREAINSGYSKSELRLDPDLSELRKTQVFRQIVGTAL